MGFRVWGSGFGVCGSGIQVMILGYGFFSIFLFQAFFCSRHFFPFLGSGPRVLLGFRVYDFGLMVQGLGFES